MGSRYGGKEDPVQAMHNHKEVRKCSTVQMQGGQRKQGVPPCECREAGRNAGRLGEAG